MTPRRSILTAALIVALLHLYIGARLLPALPWPMALKTLAALWLAISTVSMPAALLARRFEPPWGDRLSWLGMLAMGLFSTLLILTVLRELVLLACALAGWYPAALPVWSAAATVALALLISLLGYWNARRVARVVDVEVPIAGLPAALDGFTIAQLSDIHVGPTIKRPYLQRIVERVHTLGADAIAITGDLVDGKVPELREHTAPLASLRAPHGVYFVTGNHEYYAGAHAWIDELRRLGLRVLLNEHVAIERDGARLVLAGVTDFSAGHFDPAHRSDPNAALAGAPSDAAVRVLLAHQPRSAVAAAEAGFDLQLSGHTHGGQFLPWNLFVPMQQPYVAGLHRHGSMWVYVSRGTGYWGPPKRFGAPSEITRIRLRRAQP
ncbi:metallophosphoesterase [Cupriavidus gilardii]|uniref:metallophosphoesterase n=1 Tax=Cupriavidus gilardii TaxID=82541 RepID=UPI001571FF0D|nr:metallophosphoesterase [Cupriavidus gilardii]MCG5262382.1 metallophosphoesterase [Cupriavidus gilardii]MDF9431186.1 metallophosphoesterase [Cupriavidus gilardii]NSX05697.1 metallophosphoesterase [Cupriavidus gilardii]